MDTWLEKFPKTLSHVTHSTSNLVTKLDHFLAEDVLFGQDGLPRGVLWQSLQNDANALRSLLEIKQYRSQLRDIVGELRQLALACKEVRRQVSHSKPFEGSKLTLGTETNRQRRRATNHIRAGLPSCHCRVCKLRRLHRVNETIG